MDALIRTERHSSMKFQLLPSQWQKTITGTPHGQEMDYSWNESDFRKEGWNRDELPRGHSDEQVPGTASTSPIIPLAIKFLILGNKSVFATGDVVDRILFVAKEAEKTWNYRRKVMGTLVVRSRGQNFKQCIEDIKKQYPGMDNTSIRRKIFTDCLLVAFKIHSNIAQAPQEQKQAMDKALLEWESDFVRQQQDPSWTPEPYKSRTLEPAQLDELSAVLKDVDYYFICRKEDCLWVGLNSEWPKHRKKYKFMCPMCGVKYDGWVERKDRIPAQKIWVVQDVDVDQAQIAIDILRDELKGAQKSPGGHPDALSASGTAISPDDIPNLPGHLSTDSDRSAKKLCMLTTWPPQETAKLLDTFKEITADVDKRWSTTAKTDIASEVTKYVRATAKYYMEPHPQRTSVLQGNSETYAYEHLPPTLLGFFYKYNPQEPILAHTDMMRFWALTRGMAREARSRL
jgi:hypothetical protein